MERSQGTHKPDRNLASSVVLAQCFSCILNSVYHNRPVHKYAKLCPPNISKSIITSAPMLKRCPSLIIIPLLLLRALRAAVKGQRHENT
jgi:hypothetical protein